MKLIKKTLHFLVFICFACFAYVQYNDSDASLWIIIYGFVAIIALGSM
ncbi:MAG: transmembrane 220 family protein, partial [Saprospiraceae bacterium]